MKLVSQILHIPPCKDSPVGAEESCVDLASTTPAKDAKELVVACMQQGKKYLLH